MKEKTRNLHTDLGALAFFSKLEMKNVILVAYATFAILFLLYLALPNPDFPSQSTAFLQSSEPADIETPLRRGYYTDLSREEVLNYYESETSELTAFKIRFLSYRLNYPPEESQMLIRDQTRSTFLEEIVHPLRESFFVSGFEPKEDKDVIVVDGYKWRQKVIIRYVPSSMAIRLIVGGGIIALMLVTYKEWFFTIKSLSRYIPPVFNKK